MQTPTTTRRDIYSSFIDRLLRISDTRSHMTKVIAVMRSPSATITAFLEDRTATPRQAFDFFATSFIYYVIGAALYALAARSSDDLAMFLSQVIGLIIVTLVLTALYEFFARTSEVERRFTDHMIIYTLILGSAVMLSAIGLVLGAIFAPIGAIIGLIAFVWGLVMLVLLFSRYWEIPLPTVAVYTVGGGILGAVLAGLIGFILVTLL